MNGVLSCLALLGPSLQGVPVLEKVLPAAIINLLKHQQKIVHVTSLGRRLINGVLVVTLFASSDVSPGISLAKSLPRKR